MNGMTTKDWKNLDALYDQRTRDTLDWCIGVSSFDDRQEDIAERYGIDRTEVSRLANIGHYADCFVTIGHELLPNLPNSTRSLYALISANKDGKRLTKSQIKQLCAGGRPTRSMIKAYKQNIGLLPAPPKKALAKSGSDSLRYIAGVVPARDLDGLSEFGARALEKQQDALFSLMDAVDSKLKPKVAELQVKVLYAYQKQMDVEVRKQVKIAVKEKQAKLDNELKKVMAREKRLTHGINEKDRKLIQSVLHPDKAPTGMESRYSRAFAAFRKIA